MPEDFYNPRHLSPGRQVPITGHPNYEQASKVNRMGEWDPDHRPADVALKITDNGRTLIFRLDVQGEGAMEMAVESDLKTGRLLYRGMKLCLGTK